MSSRDGINAIVLVLGGPSKYYAALVKSEESSTWKGLGEFIRAQRQLADLSLRQLAELAKVSNPYLSQVERGMYKPSAHVLKGIAEALQVSAESMYMRAGLLDEEVEAPSSVEMAIRTDLQLTTDQKETLLRVYRGLLDHS
jgi:transcriptional regulator with XRE-family HTH domain